MFSCSTGPSPFARRAGGTAGRPTRRQSKKIGFWSSQGSVDSGFSIPTRGGDANVHESEHRRVRSTYEFIKAHRGQYAVEPMCRVLGVAPSGYYEWLQQPISNRAQEDARLLRLIRASFIASHGIYGAPRVFLDLREAGEVCSKHRVARLMREANLRALHE